MAHGQHTTAYRQRPRHGAWLLAIALLTLTVLGGCASEQELRLSALTFFRQGNEAMAREDYPQAIRHYRKVIDLDDTAAAAHYNLGLAYFAMMEYEAAAEAFQATLELEPDSAAAHYNLALTYDRLYNLPLAHRHYNTYRRLAQAQVAQREPTATAPAASARRPATAPAPTTAQAGSGVQQASQPAKPAQNRAPALQTTTATAKRQAPPRRTASTPGDNQKWWIQDRFIQNQ
jgi:tetratricopeptide (TPR) repeat protein